MLKTASSKLGELLEQNRDFQAAQGCLTILQEMATDAIQSTTIPTHEAYTIYKVRAQSPRAQMGLVWGFETLLQGLSESTADFVSIHVLSSPHGKRFVFTDSQVTKLLGVLVFAQ